MKRGLTKPPIEAPVLPDGFFYRIKLVDDDYGSGSLWCVKIRRKRRIGSKRVATGWSNASMEGLIQACHSAHGQWRKKVQVNLHRDAWTGDWSGQE